AENAPALSCAQRNQYFGATGLASTKAIYSKLASQRVSPDINVSHMSMGDELVQGTRARSQRRHRASIDLVFCECLVELPMVHSLNLRNNRLTDAGIAAVVRVRRRRRHRAVVVSMARKNSRRAQAVMNKPDLCTLDLSENKVDGDGAAALAAYMATATCGLSTLLLSHCDLGTIGGGGGVIEATHTHVDDGEARAFASAMCTNRTCHTLDLSRNLIGANEALNVVQPDLVTGGEALAEMLATNGHLTVLNLSWNFLRLNSAVELGRALAQNNTLKALNLSYNAFGNDGAQAIGCALQHNMCLESLDMSNNNIPSQAAFVMAESLHHNDTLTLLAMDGNPLGRIGGMTLLHAIS
ncbi:hypothetical protein DYB32_009341, partial [Aphanomyces invadans]